MQIEEKLQRILSDSSVINMALECLNDEVPKSILVHLSNESQVTIGIPVDQDEIEVARLRVETEDMPYTDARLLRLWAAYSLLEMDLTLNGYEFAHDHMPKSGIFTLTKWRKSILSGEPKIPDLSVFISFPTLIDIIQLNELTRRYGSGALLVRAEMVHRHYISIAARQQKVRAMDEFDMQNVLLAGDLRFSGHPLAEQTCSYYYQTMRGIVRLPERTVQLDYNLEKMVKRVEGK